MYNAEILPPVGVGICTLINWVFTILVTLVFPIGTQYAGIQVMFFVFMMFCVLGIIMIFFLCKETKGKTLAEIDELWDKDLRKKGLL